MVHHDSLDLFPGFNIYRTVDASGMAAVLLDQLGDEPDLVAVQVGELEEVHDPFESL